MTHRWLVGTMGVLALAAALALIGAGGGASLAEDGIIYVDAAATGSDNGVDWTNAFTDLQSALSIAAEGKQIWVAAGTYKPTDGSDRTISFQMKNGVAIYGGFAGDETELGQRDWVANPTILSGDIGEEGNPDDNAYHVFYHVGGLDTTAILDGFTITGGNAEGSYPDYDSGGGMQNVDSSPTLTNCTFSSNEASRDGGGMHNQDSSPTLTNCTFAGNSARIGGGMLNWRSSPTLTNCTFSSNEASTDGGGMYSFGFGDSPTLTGCSFANNTAGTSGGGMFNWGASPTLTNVTFSGNSARVVGGGICNDDSSPTLTNCILWGDTAGGLPSEIYSDANSSPDVTYSDIQGGCENIPGNECGAGNIDADPFFLGAGNGDLRLQITSPAIDAGDNDAPDLAGVALDLGGHPRFADVLSVTDSGNGDRPIVDMGAYEAPPEVILVDQDAFGTDDGQSWEDAITDLQDALAWAVSGVEIWVAEGTYRPTWRFDTSDPRSATFQMVNGVAIYGGFDPSVGDTGWEDRDWIVHETVLSGNTGDEETSVDNSYHVFYHPDATYLDGTAILDGFTITGGNADRAWPHNCGGGMFNYHSSPALTDCTFTGNLAYDGGGMYNYMLSSPTLTGCTFSGNSATEQGGGMYNSLSSPTLTNCTFANNTAGTQGGGVLFAGSLPILVNCILWGDTAGELPDEIYSSGSTPDVTYSDIQGGYSGEGNKDEDPLFADPDNGDFHLGPGSPCIDAGTNAAPYLPPYDFEGDARIIDGDGDGEPVVDMGVDEVRLSVYLPLVLRAY